MTTRQRCNARAVAAALLSYVGAATSLNVPVAEMSVLSVDLTNLYRCAVGLDTVGRVGRDPELLAEVHAAMGGEDAYRPCYRRGVWTFGGI